MIKVRLFARLKDLAGRPDVSLRLDRPTPLKGLWGTLREEIPDVIDWVKDGRVLVAVNQEMATEETVIHDGDEIGLMPPFSGGGGVGSTRRSEPSVRGDRRSRASASEDWTRIQAEDFSLDRELRRIGGVSKRIGGIAFFVGTARDFSKGQPVTGLEYEHYQGLAEKTLRQIRQRALQRFQISEVCIIHRTGPIPVGGNIVLIAAAAEHREAAFQACRWCIDELKASVPIWKRETGPDGRTWIEDRP
jgi:molybdopterin synthase catalytic subunit/molybdopterin converting factor small subunit